LSTGVKGIYIETSEPAMAIRAGKRIELDRNIRTAGKSSGNKRTRREVLHARSRQMSLRELSRTPSPRL